MSMDVAKDRVAAGIKFLDEKVGFGYSLNEWRKKIDLEKLSLSSTNDCILGQIYGDYYEGTEVLALVGNHEYNYGFCPGSGSDGHADSNELDMAWRNALKAVSIDKLQVGDYVKQNATQLYKIVALFKHDVVEKAVIEKGRLEGEEWTPANTMWEPNTSIVPVSYLTKRSTFAFKEGDVLKADDDSGTALFYASSSTKLWKLEDNAGYSDLDYWVSAQGYKNFRHLRIRGGSDFNTKSGVIID